MEKRFRIFNADEQGLVGKYDKMIDVVIKLKSLDHGLAYYFVDDTVDDIEVPAEDILEADRNGEVFDDLQFF